MDQALFLLHCSTPLTVKKKSSKSTKELFFFLLVGEGRKLGDKKDSFSVSSHTEKSREVPIIRIHASNLGQRWANKQISQRFGW